MPAYRPGQGLSGQAVDRLKARVQAQSGAFTLPSQDISKQWDHLLGEGATKKTRCSMCTRPLGDDKDGQGMSLCALCEPLPLDNIGACENQSRKVGGRAKATSQKASGPSTTNVLASSELRAPDLVPPLMSPLQQVALTTTKFGPFGDRCNIAESSVCSTADPEEAGDESWDSWLDSAVQTPEMPPASALGLCEPLLPSIGSQKHYLNACKPCAFVHKGGCGNGSACEFCHLCLPGTKKHRKKERRAAVRSFQQQHIPRSMEKA